MRSSAAFPIALALALAGCDRGEAPRFVLRVVVPRTDPLASAESVRVTYESETSVPFGPASVEDGRFGLSLDLPADVAAGRFVVEALDADGALVGHGATPVVQPALVAGIEARVLVAAPLLPEEGPTQPPEDLGAPAAATLGGEWLATTTATGNLIVYDLLVHDWARGVAEPPSPVEDATAVPLGSVAVAFAGGAGIRIYDGLGNAWIDVEMPDGFEAWTRPAAIECPDGSVLFAGGGTDAVVRIATDGTASLEAPLAATRAGATASTDGDGRAVVVGGAPEIEIVGCDGAREVVTDVAGADLSGHGAARLADGTVLVAGGGTQDGLWLPADCGGDACEPLASGPLLTEPRSDLALAALPEGGAVALGAGGALRLDPDSWTATPIGGDDLDASPAVFPLPTGHLAALAGERLVFLAPGTLFAPL